MSRAWTAPSLGSSASREGCWPSSTAASPRPDRERIEIVGGDATLVLEAPFLPEPDGPPPSVTLWRGRDATAVEVASLDQYHAEVENLTSVILDGATPLLDLPSSRGNVATLVALERLARADAGLAPANRDAQPA